MMLQPEAEYNHEEISENTNLGTPDKISVLCALKNVIIKEKTSNKGG